MRDKLDRYYTENPWVVNLLMDRLKEKETDLGLAFEPCCGMGDIDSILRQHFDDVVVNDIDKGLKRKLDYNENFITMNREECKLLAGDYIQWVITNPPYMITKSESPTGETLKASDFVKKALKMTDKGVAMFMRLTWLEPCDDRRKILQETPPDKVIIIHPRISFGHHTNTDFTTHAWYIWYDVNDLTGSTELEYYHHEK